MFRFGFLAAALAAAATTLSAQCPNDECINAIVVPAGLNGPYDNSCATTSVPAWPCGGGGNDLWYCYTHTGAAGSVSADTCTGSTFDTTLEVFSGPCTALTSLVCNDDSCGFQSAASFTAAPATTYYIRVGGFASATGMFNLRISAAAQCPPADECVTAIPARVGLNGPYNTACATTSVPAWPCGAGGADLWFVYRHTGWNATVDVNTCTGTTFDTTLEVFSGACTSLTSLGCNDDTCGLQSQVIFSATQGMTYYIRVGGFGGGTGNFSLTIKIAGSFTSVSPGCGGSTLVGTSSAGSGLPEIGSTMTLTVTPAAGIAQAIWLGLPQPPVTLCPGCALSCTMAVSLPGGPIANVPIPNNTALCGACLCFQGASIYVPSGPGCSLGGFSFTLTDSVQVLIGC